jgi:hypothetical protein
MQGGHGEAQWKSFLIGVSQQGCICTPTRGWLGEAVAVPHHHQHKDIYWVGVRYNLISIHLS